jgi:branched-subunit amino acid ABC-type transport system permease component
MSAYLALIVIGITSGAVYALASLGLVVTYTTTGIFNFAHGAIGMVAAYVFFSLRVSAGLPTPLALIIAVFLVAPAMGLIIDRLLSGGHGDTPPAVSIVISLGLLVALQGIITAVYGTTARQVASIFPTSHYSLPGVNVGYDQTIVVAIAVGVAVALVAFFRLTHLGLQMRAQVDSPTMVDLVGADARRITAASWMLGCSLAALAAILLVPSIGLDAATLTLLVVQAFGAAVFARLRSLPMAFAGAMLIGVLAALSSKFVGSNRALIGLPASMPFIVLFVVLVASRKGRFSESHRPARGHSAGARDSKPSRLLIAVPLLVALPFVVNSSHLLTATATLAFVLIFVSLGLVVGVARQLSLCHAVFVAFGATILAHLLNAHVPFLVALPLAGFLVVPFGLVISIPAIRLSGVFLALATFGFGVLAQSLLFSTSIGFGAADEISLKRPSVLGISLNGDKGYYFFVLAIVLVGVAAVAVLVKSRLGRLLIAVADSPTGYESIGLRPATTYVLVLCISAFLAAVAGGLLGGLFQSANPNSFDYFNSLIWVTLLVATGASSIGGASLAAILLVALPGVVTSHLVTEYQPVAFGIAAILLAQQPNGLVGLVSGHRFDNLARRSAWRLERSPVRERMAS